jgi:hypothetical protein
VLQASEHTLEPIEYSLLTTGCSDPLFGVVMDIRKLDICWRYNDLERVVTGIHDVVCLTHFVFGGLADTMYSILDTFGN